MEVQPIEIKFAEFIRVYLRKEIQKNKSKLKIITLDEFETLYCQYVNDLFYDETNNSNLLLHVTLCMKQIYGNNIQDIIHGSLFYKLVNEMRKRGVNEDMFDETYGLKTSCDIINNFVMMIEETHRTRIMNNLYMDMKFM
jgi:hypothetical protein